MLYVDVFLLVFLTFGLAIRCFIKLTSHPNIYAGKGIVKSQATHETTVTRTVLIVIPRGSNFGGHLFTLLRPTKIIDDKPAISYWELATGNGKHINWYRTCTFLQFQAELGKQCRYTHQVHLYP